MAEHPRWFVGNRNPPIFETITYDDGTVVDLTGATVRFRMRAVGSSTLKVDQPATVVTPAAGEVRYNWAALDVDTAADYLVWWQVTAGGLTQDLNEAMIEVAAHTPLDGYVELEELKSTLEITGGHADQDLQTAITAASSVVDVLTGRTFTAAAAGTRLYTPIAYEWLRIHDVASITSVAVSGEAWVENTDYELDGTDLLRVLNGNLFPVGDAQSVEVVASFGFAVVPAEVKFATSVIATQLFKRSREAPFGILSLTLTGEALRIGRFDPQIDLALMKWNQAATMVG